MKIYKQHGFTLIELIMVIVIMGILAVVALPKFANLSGDARKAAVTGAQGSVKSAVGIVHAKALVESKVTTSDSSESVALEGATITLKYGYPDANTIDEAAGISSTDYNVTVASGVATISATKDGGANPVANCKFTYTPSASAGAAPTISDVTFSGC